jgi:hypothetical protein
VPVWFDGLRALKITGRRSEDVDIQLRFGSGAIVVAPVRAVPGFDQLSLPYSELQRATFARERNPRWVTNSTPPLAAPPANLDPPGTVFAGARRWLVLQSTSWFVVLTLADETWEQVLNTVFERTHVKIDGRPQSKD